MYPVWVNQDAVAHTVAFADGGCSIEVAPGAYGQCTHGFSSVVGNYAYTVDGTIQASIVVRAEGRIVTLKATSHRIGRGSKLLLHGKLAVATTNPLDAAGSSAAGDPACAPRPLPPVSPNCGRHCETRSPLDEPAECPLGLAATRSTRNKQDYIAEANSQPQGGQVWQRAWSKPFRVRIGR